MVEQNQLTIIKPRRYIRIHVDNYIKDIESKCNFTSCGLCASNNVFHFLGKSFTNNKIKVCKKCSQIYRRKYGHTLESFLARLKVQNKLYVDH